MARSQDNFHRPDSFGVGWFWYAVVLALFGVWTSYKTRKATPKLELRQRQLRAVLAALDARE